MYVGFLYFSMWSVCIGKIVAFFFPGHDDFKHFLTAYNQFDGLRITVTLL
jgi:hypothetical protein